MGDMRRAFSLAIIVFVLNGVWSCSSSEGDKSTYSNEAEGTEDKTKKLFAADYGEQWPLKGVKEGTVECVDGFYVVFVTANGTYAVNGAAKSQELMREKGWLSLDQVHVLGKDISPILEAGKALCK